MQRGSITLAFDDGYQHILSDIVPLLNRYHVPAVFAIPLDNISVSQKEGIPVAPYSDWLPIKNKGHELAGHSITHADLTSLSDQDLNEQLIVPRDTLSATTLIYPGGAQNKRVEKQASLYYTAARTVKRGFNALPPKNSMQLKTFNFTKDNFSVAKANTLALWAMLSNRWLIETYHVVSNKITDNPYAIDISCFEKHLRFISRLPIRKTTIQQAVLSN